MPIYYTVLVYYIVIVDWQHFVGYLFIVMHGLLTTFYIFIVQYTFIKKKAVKIEYTTV